MINVILISTARGASTPTELFLRVGEAPYSQVASLYSECRLPIRRAITDASKLKHQRDFIKTLSLRLVAHALRNEKIRSSLENLHSMRGLDAPRVPAARLSERVRIGRRS